MNIRYRLMEFMSGRYGVDPTFYVLFGISAVLAFFNIFIRFWLLQIFIYIFSMFAVFRMFSRNIEARRRENTMVCSGVIAISKWYLRYKTRMADKTHIYKKCPSCRAILRLPRRKGKHTTVCPNCGKEFKVKVFRE